MINPNYNQSGSKYQNTPQIVAGVVAALFAAACALGPRVGFEPHSAFMLGAGNLPQDVVSSLPFGMFHVGMCTTHCIHRTHRIILHDLHSHARRTR
jgi:hypothetical protein